MPILFNDLLDTARLPLQEVRLIRHKDGRASKGYTPYELWRDHRPQFDIYQSSQGEQNRKKLSDSYWAVFIVNLNDETMFAGIYRAKFRGLWEQDTPSPHIKGEILLAGSCDGYDLTLTDFLSDMIGKLFIDWGLGALAWIQYADRNNKPIIELRTAFMEETFPGFLNFVQPLSKLGKVPKTWITALSSMRGVYLLTCPKTKELYVGSACGELGFWGRWQNYIQTGHGGNVGLKHRDPSDYQISILEVAGTAAQEGEVLSMEGRWQKKLQCMAMGLNRNWAGE